MKDEHLARRISMIGKIVRYGPNYYTIAPRSKKDASKLIQIVKEYSAQRNNPITKVIKSGDNKDLEAFYDEKGGIEIEDIFDKDIDDAIYTGRLTPISKDIKEYEITITVSTSITAFARSSNEAKKKIEMYIESGTWNPNDDMPEATQGDMKARELKRKYR